MTLYEILFFKYPAQLANGQIIVKEAFDGPYIDKWQMGSIPKPSPSEVQAMINDDDFKTNYALWARVNAPDGYKPVPEQLGMLFDDLKNKTQTWTQHNIDVKNRYPKASQPLISDIITPIVVEKRNSPSASFKEILIAKSSTSQAISGTSKTNVNLTIEVSDPNNVFTSNQYTALTGGLYEVSAFVQMTNVAITASVLNYSWSLYLVQSGSTASTNIIGTYTHGIPYPIPSSMQGTHMVYLSSGDKLALQVDKTITTSLNVTFAYLNIKKISEA